MTTPDSVKGRLATFIPLFLVLIIDAMGTGLVLPMLSPIYMQIDGGILSPSVSEPIRNMLYGLTLAAFSFSLFFGAPLLGDLSDKIGRKKVLLICLLGTALSFLLSASGIYFKSVILLISGRFFAGFFAGSQSIAQAAITDISTEKNKAFNLSMITAASCTGFVIGPIMGGVFSDVNFSQMFSLGTPFYVAALLSVANAAALILSLKETYQTRAAHTFDFFKSVKIFLSAFHRKDIRLLVAVYFIWECAWTLYFQYMSLYLMHSYQFTAARIGLYMSLLGGIFVVNMLVIVPVALKFIKIETSILSGLLLCLLGLVGSIFARSEMLQWVLAFPINIGVGLAYTTTLALFSNSVDRNSQGWIMGVATAAVSIAWFISGLAIGTVASISEVAPFVIASVFFVVSIIGMKVFINQYYAQKKGTDIVA